MTIAEVMLWKELRGKRMLGYDFHRQKPIANYGVDFFCPSLLLVIEIDGCSHDGKLREDVEREEEIAQHGLHILRVRDGDVKQNLDSVLEAIRQWIMSRGSTRQEHQT